MKRKKTSPARLPKRSTGVRKSKYVLIGSVCLTVVLVFGAVAGSWSAPLFSKTKVSFFSAPPAPSPPPPGSPSKEYIYVGGRLIATEEPSLAAPTNVAANTISGSQINVSWLPSPNAHHYQVERATHLGGTFTILNSNVSATSYPDNSVMSITAYLYRVRAVDANGNVSAGSNVDLATAITFDDDPFPNPPTLTEVRAQHILQLRLAVNAVRETANLGPWDWDQDFLQPTITTIKAIDVEELRTALDAALTELNLPAGGYTDPALSQVFIQKIHITQLRNRVK